jgi:hypothetical protein
MCIAAASLKRVQASPLGACALPAASLTKRRPRPLADSPCLSGCWRLPSPWTARQRAPKRALLTHWLPQVEAAALQRIMEALEKNQPARSVALNDEEAELGGCDA